MYCGIIEQLSDLIYFVLALLWLSVICYKVRISPDKFELEKKHKTTFSATKT